MKGIRKHRGPRLRAVLRRPSVFKLGELPGDHQDQRDPPPVVEFGTHGYGDGHIKMIVNLHGDDLAIERRP